MLTAGVVITSGLFAPHLFPNPVHHVPSIQSVSKIANTFHPSPAARLDEQNVSFKMSPIKSARAGARLRRCTFIFNARTTCRLKRFLEKENCSKKWEAFCDGWGVMLRGWGQWRKQGEGELEDRGEI